MIENLPKVAVSENERLRPMIAILKARSGMEARLRGMLMNLAKVTRQEPGCVTFLLYEAVDSKGSFYLYEVYKNDTAFMEHLNSDVVATFKAELSTVSDSDQAHDLTQLIEIARV